MSHFDTKKNRRSARSINTEDRIPLFDVSGSYSNDNDEHDDSWQSEINDLITAHGNNQHVDIESEL